MLKAARIFGVLAMALVLSAYSEKCTLMVAPYVEGEESSLVAWTEAVALANRP